jgi:GNAT superfamily N-acetyltransferase
VSGGTREWTVARVRERDLGELLPLMRGYCDFYRVAPSDDALLGLARALIADPEHEGIQLIGRDGGGRACGFATIYWSWSTSSAARIGVMNDLYVADEARGRGLAELLIAACGGECERAGAVALDWQTAPDNLRAQAVYDRVGGQRERWLCYTMPIRPAPPS